MYSIFLLLASFCHASSIQTITLDDVVKKVSSENYEVLENAIRVYQAKEAIAVARGNLLPKLNLWKIAGIVYDWKMAAAMIEDLVPFLVPANWFRLAEAKLFLLAEKEGYRALWANEVMTAKGLYFHVLLDHLILKLIEKSTNELEELYLIAVSQEILGGMPDGTSRDIKTRIISLHEDKRSMQVLINEEAAMLSFMMGAPIETEVMVSPLQMPAFDQLEALNYQDFVFRAVDSSPEVKQFDYFIEASDYVRKEVIFSFLGGSSMGGLGFGTGPSFRIVRAEKERLKLQKKSATETVKRQLKLLIDNYNLDLANYADLTRHAELTEISLNQLYRRLDLGETIEVAKLVEASQNHIQADISLLATKYRFLGNSDKLSRIIFQGDYNKEPAAVELVRERLLQ